MNKKSKIIMAILGGAVVGALGVCGVVWPQQVFIFVSASGLVTMVVASVTGFTITKE